MALLKEARKTETARMAAERQTFHVANQIEYVQKKKEYEEKKRLDQIHYDEVRI